VEVGRVSEHKEQVLRVMELFTRLFTRFTQVIVTTYPTYRYNCFIHMQYYRAYLHYCHSFI